MPNVLIIFTCIISNESCIGRDGMTFARSMARNHMVWKYRQKNCFCVHALRGFDS